MLNMDIRREWRRVCFWSGCEFIGYGIEMSELFGGVDEEMIIVVDCVWKELSVLLLLLKYVIFILIKVFYYVLKVVVS